MTDLWQKIKQNWYCYLTGLALIFLGKYTYSRALAQDLTWILTPTTRWVGILTGIPFAWDPRAGYINHQLRFIIAPSCSGMQFLIVSFSMLIFSCVHRMKTSVGKYTWIGLSLALSYLLTVFVNGIRIAVSIGLPLYFKRSNLQWRGLAPDRLHTLIGIVLYFTTLFLLYRAADYFTRAAAFGATKKTAKPGFSFSRLRQWSVPLFWYFFITLGLPLLNGAWKTSPIRFLYHGLLMVVVCMTILLLAFFIDIARDYWHNRFNA